MLEKLMDKKLGIQTGGIRDYVGKNQGFNRYEASPYKALKTLLTHYRFTRRDKLLDFGCGKGRVLFYIHHHCDIPVVGVEGDFETYSDALRNLQSYRRLHPEHRAKISLEYAFAEVYPLEDDENVFFFFNPFDLPTFEAVGENILASYARKPRTMDIILYYPYADFQRFLERQTPFILRAEYRLKLTDNKDKLSLYRLE